MKTIELPAAVANLVSRKKTELVLDIRSYLLNLAGAHDSQTCNRNAQAQAQV